MGALWGGAVSDERETPVRGANTLELMARGGPVKNLFLTCSGLWKPRPCSKAVLD